VKRRHSRAVAFIVFIVVSCMVVVLDRITKTLAVEALNGGATQAFIPGFLDFQLVYNTGAAWGMLEGARTLFIVIGVFTIGAMILFLALMRRHSVFMILGLGMIAGGAVGNTIDRALSGRVVDFIHTLFIEFPFFNIADSAITVGAVLFMVAVVFDETWRARGKGGREASESPESSEVLKVSGSPETPGVSETPASRGVSESPETPEAGKSYEARERSEENATGEENESSEENATGEACQKVEESTDAPL
jgi:signal peptidase II